MKYVKARMSADFCTGAATRATAAGGQSERAAPIKWRSTTKTVFQSITRLKQQQKLGKWMVAISLQLLRKS